MTRTLSIAPIRRKVVVSRSGVTVRDGGSGRGLSEGRAALSHGFEAGDEPEDVARVGPRGRAEETVDRLVDDV